MSASPGVMDAARHLVEVERVERRDRDLSAPESQIRGALSRYWKAQRDELLPRLDDLRTYFAESPGQAGDDYDRAWQAATAALADAARRLGTTVAEALRRAVALGGQSFVRDVGLDLAFDVDSPAAQRFLADRGANLVAGVDETTRQQMRGVIERGVRDGRTYAQTADEISRRFAGFSDPSVMGHIRTRAELVAVTETATAYEHAHSLAGDDLEAAGVGVEKRWIDAGDARVHAGCAANSGAGWIGHREVFPTGVANPPDHAGCRCATGRRAASGDFDSSRLPSGASLTAS